MEFLSLGRQAVGGGLLSFVGAQWQGGRTMKASELRPGQWFEFPDQRERLQKVDYHRNNFVWYIDSKYKLWWCGSDLEVTPLNVHGWDDEPQSEPDAIDAQYLLKLLAYIVNHAQYSSAHVGFAKVPTYLLDEPKRILESQKPAPLQLREGAWYRRRDGEIVGPMRNRNPEDIGCYFYPFVIGKTYYTIDGETHNKPEWNLVSEVPPNQSMDGTPPRPDVQEPQPAPITHWVEVVGL